MRISRRECPEIWGLVCRKEKYKRFETIYGFVPMPEVVNINDNFELVESNTREDRLINRLCNGERIQLLQR